MKTKKMLLGLSASIIALNFIACDSETKPKVSDPIKPTCYWDTNAWNQLKLKNKVKSISSSRNGTTTFSSEGQILSTKNQYSETTFEYSLNKTIETQTQLSDNKKTTYTYTFGSHGKYVPKAPFHINMAGLVKNLIKVERTAGLATNLSFNGNTFLMSSYNADNKLDTFMLVTYEGVFPSKNAMKPGYDGQGTILNITYQPNGMFKVYEEGFYGNDNVDSRKSYYKEHPNYLLIEKMVMTYTSSSNPDFNSTTTTTYVYNDKFDIISESADGNNSFINEYRYIYDASGNWTKIETRKKEGGNPWSDWGVQETRTIIYW